MHIYSFHILWSFDHDTQFLIVHHLRLHNTYFKFKFHLTKTVWPSAWISCHLWQTALPGLYPAARAKASLAAGETSSTIPQKLTTELSCDPAITLLGFHTKELKAGTQTGSCAPMFMAALFTTAKRGRTTWVSINTWVDTMWWRPYNEISFHHKREWNSDAATVCMNVGNIRRSEVRYNRSTDIVWFHLHKISTTGKFIKTESRFEVTGAGVVGNGKLLLSGYKVSFWGDKFWK